MEKQKINIKYYLGFVICMFLFLFGVVTFVVWIMPMGAEKLDTHFNPKQEIVEERFTREYSGILNVYNDNELNVTCWETGYSGVGLSCIPDAEIGRR